MAWCGAGLMNAVLVSSVAVAVYFVRGGRQSPAQRHAYWSFLLLLLLSPVGLVWPVAGTDVGLAGVLGQIWLTGSLLFLIQRLICLAVAWRQIGAGDEVENSAAQRLVADVARQAGLTNMPRFVLSDVASPQLFGLPGAVAILFPVRVWRVLDSSSRRALLAHELGHLRRRDHWVRLLEIVTQILFWWLPIVWIAARQIETAEEDCCDNWVVHQMNVNRRAYADGILMTLQLARRPRGGLTDRLLAYTHWMLPGSEVSIEHRLRRIMMAPPLPHVLPSWRLRGMAVLGACLSLMLLSMAAPLFEPATGPLEPVAEPFVAELPKPSPAPQASTFSLRQTNPGGKLPAQATEIRQLDLVAPESPFADATDDLRLEVQPLANAEERPL